MIKVSFKVVFFFKDKFEADSNLSSWARLLNC